MAACQHDEGVQNASRSAKEALKIVANNIPESFVPVVTDDLTTTWS